MQLLDVSFFHDRLLNCCHEWNLPHKKKKNVHTFPFTRGEAPSFSDLAKAQLIQNATGTTQNGHLVVLLHLCHSGCVLIFYMQKNHHLSFSFISGTNIIVFICHPPKMPWMMCPLSCQSCRLEVITFSERTAHLSFWTAIYGMQWCPRNKARSATSVSSKQQLSSEVKSQ